jgi:hypothetical protein
MRQIKLLHINSNIINIFCQEITIQFFGRKISKNQNTSFLAGKISKNRYSSKLAPRGALNPVPILNFQNKNYTDSKNYYLIHLLCLCLISMEVLHRIIGIQSSCIKASRLWTGWLCTGRLLSGWLCTGRLLSGRRRTGRL